MAILGKVATFGPTLLVLLALGVFNVQFAYCQSICSSQPTPCKCVLNSAQGSDQGKTIDLAPVANAPGTVPKFNVEGVDGFVYFYNPCHDASVPSTECDSMAACQLWQSVYSVIGYNDNKAQFRQDARGKYIYYEGALNNFLEPRKTHVYLECDEAQLQPILKAEGDLSTPYLYVMQLTSKWACPEGEVAPTGSFHSETTVSVSIGTYMCIGLIVIVFVYVAGGVAYMAIKNEARGADLIPNREFWMDFPKLIKDGGAFIVDMIRSRRGGGEKAYEQM